MLRKLLLTMLGLVIITACANSRNEPVDVQCKKNIKRANTMLTEHQEEMTKEKIQTIELEGSFQVNEITLYKSTLTPQGSIYEKLYTSNLTS